MPVTFAASTFLSSTSVSGFGSNGDVTLACWAFISDLSTYRQLMWVNHDAGGGGAGVGADYIATNGGGTPLMDLSSFAGGTFHTVSPSVTVNTWTHWAMTYVASTGVVTGYKDGVNVGSSSAGSLGARDAVVDIEIGNFPGQIQDVFFFNQALAANQVLALYRARRPPAEPAAWYPMTNVATSAADFSGSGRTMSVSGTAVAAATSAPAAGWGASLLNPILPTVVAPTALVAAGVSPSSGTAALTLVNALAAAGISPSSGTVTLTLAAALAAAGISPSSGAAALTLANALAASGTSPSSGTAALTAALPIVAAGVSPSSGTAALTAALPIAAAGVSPSSGTVTLTVAGSSSLVAAGVSPSSGTAALTAALPLAAAGVSPSSGAASLTLTSSPTANSNSASSGTAALTLAVSLVASSDTASSGLVTLTGGVPYVPGTGSGFDPRSRLTVRRPNRRQ